MFRRHLTRVALTAFALSVVAHAQTSQTSGALRGVVKDRSGRIISGASVRVTNIETGAGRTLRTGPAGDYTFPLLPSGNYDVLISAPGFKPVKESGIRVTLGNSVTLNPALDASEVGATVEVVANASTVDTTQVNTVSTIGQDLVEAVPLVTRNFTDIAKLSPGVTAGSGSPARLVVEGGRQIFNAIQIDGASNNSAFFNEQRGGVYTPFIFGADTIKELQVVTNGFDVQYAQAGATINAITKGGTNEVTGSALYELRQTAWTESAQRPPFGGTAASPRTNDSYNLNFNVGGPIIKEKLFYFVGVERYHKKITANPIATTTSAALGMTPGDLTTFLASPLGGIITNRSGLTLAQEFGNPGAGIAANAYPMENTNTVYFGRLDWVASPDHRFVLRSNFQDMKDTLANTSASPNNAESNNIPTRVQSISWVIEANDIWTPELYTESRLQLAREARPMTGNAAPGTPAIALPTSATNMSFGTKTSTPRESNEITSQFFSATTWSHGDLQLKGGIDLLRVDEDNQFFQNNAGSWRFDTYGGATAWATGALAAGTPGGIVYAGAVSPYNGRIPMWTHTNGLFAQAQYAGLLNKRLILTAGLRYNKQEFSNNPHPNANFKGLDQGFGGSSTDPRLAFSYDLDGNGKTVIRGGYGVFTSPTPLLLHSNTMTGNGQIITNYSFALNKADVNNLALFNSGLLSATNLLSGTSLRKATDAELSSIATSGLFTAGASPTSLWDPNNKLSQSKKLNLGIERDLGHNLVVGVSATYVKYEHLQRFENINLGQKDALGVLIPGGYYNDGYASSNNSWQTSHLVGTTVVNDRPMFAVIGGRRVDFGPGASVPGNPVGGFSDVYLVKTDGYGDYRGLSFTAKKTWNDRTGLIANATWSKSKDTGSFERGTYTSASTDFTSELGASQTQDPQNPGSNYGYGDSDRRWVANVVFYFPVGDLFDVAIRGLYQTGLPYTTYFSNDLNGDNMANHIMDGHSRNDQREPNYTQFDLRMTRSFKITKRFQVEGIVDVYNLFNKADFFVPAAGYKWGSSLTGVQSASYGQLSQVDKTKTREIQLGIRLKF